MKKVVALCIMFNISASSYIELSHGIFVSVLILLLLNALYLRFKLLFLVKVLNDEDDDFNSPEYRSKFSLLSLNPGYKYL